MAAFWVVAPCSLVEVIGLMMEAARTSETLVNFYQTTRRYNPEDSHLHLHTYSQGVTTEKNIIIFTAVRASNLTQMSLVD
jgi:hypothetical protein